MKRKRYRNGDEITLPCGCNSCTPSRINGIICHEIGCPDAWRDYKRECFECGKEFYPEERRQENCKRCNH